ncbi:MAG: TolC family protein, partial [Planctomycetaceae bacterium]|nr:TolC family protein [Planctomycetaceae bacterium]
GGGGAGDVGGFLGLLQRSQQIRNSEQSLELQVNTLELLELLFEGSFIERSQVDQFRQSIETERATLLQAQIGLQDSLENYLIETLGLPPDLPVELDKEFIKGFEFIGDDVLEVQDKLTKILSEFGDNEDPSEEVIGEFLGRTEDIFTETDALLETIDGDVEEHDEKIQTRLDRMTATEKKDYEANREDMEDYLKDAKKSLKEAAETLTKLKEGLDAEKADVVIVKFTSLLKQMQNTVGELSQIQARAKLAIIDVQQIDLKPQQALEIARAHRLDWMNNRAALVDTWRLIQFNANALKSDVTLRLDGDVSTLGGDNPLKFRGETGTVRASLQFDPPFTRLTERNNFRQQLIEYQQARRQLIQYEDRVYYSLRQILRNLELNKVNLEIQRRAVSLAISRVEETRLRLNQPVAPAPPGATGGGGGNQFGATPGLDLLNALSDLRNTQNNFLSVYLNYYASRMVLMRELGIMQIDCEGMWIDEPIEITLAMLSEYECDVLPPEVPNEWLNPGYFDENSPEGVMKPGTIPAPIPAPNEDEKPRVTDTNLPASRPKRATVAEEEME